MFLQQLTMGTLRRSLRIPAAALRDSEAHVPPAADDGRLADLRVVVVVAVVDALKHLLPRRPRQLASFFGVPLELLGQLGNGIWFVLTAFLAPSTMSFHVSPSSVHLRGTPGTTLLHTCAGCVFLVFVDKWKHTSPAVLSDTAIFISSTSCFAPVIMSSHPFTTAIDFSGAPRPLLFHFGA